MHVSEVRTTAAAGMFVVHLRWRRLFAASAAALLAACGDAGKSATAGPSGAKDAAMGKPAAAVEAGPLDYTPPPDSVIPDDELGKSIRRGLALVVNTTDSLPGYAPGNIQCASCHLNGGRTRDAASLAGVYARFPKYMDRSGAVIPLEDRINYCFTRSLAGTRLPPNSREMQDIIAYLAFLSSGVPVGSHVKGEGMPKMPALSGDSARGAALFATTCVACHGAEGNGNRPLIPALWGAASYSIGASMAREERAATFIRHFMPKSNPGSLTDQQAYDLAAYINSHPRPDSPGKEKDWPLGGAAADVPYNTVGHVAFKPPQKLLPRKNVAGSIVEPPQSAGGAKKVTGSAPPAAILPESR